MSRTRSILLCVALAGALGSCDTARKLAPVDTGPAASSPAGAVQRLGWAFDHRDIGAVAGLLAADLQFQTFETDSAGNAPALVQWPRDSVLVALRSLFDGVPGVSGPATVKLSLDANLLPFPDTRVGKNAKWHKTVRSSADLRVADPASGSRFEVTGYLLFYLTRGDSAAIPADQAALGARADSSRWWIDRLDDETLGGIGVHAEPAQTNPSHQFTFGQILRFYLDHTRR